MSSNEANAFGRAQSGTPTHLMVDLGDSLTAASLADTTLSLPPAKFDPLQYRVNGETDENQVDAKILYENKKTYSWASGERIDSHFTRLRDRLAQESKVLTIMNAAVPGAKSADLEAQAQKVVDQVREDHSQLEYVTLLMGANDVCSNKSPVGTPDNIFYENVMKSLTKLSEIQQEAPIRILISALPRIADLGAPNIIHHKVKFGLTCGKIRDQIIKYCTSLTVWNTDAEHQKRSDVVAGKNALLRQVAQDAQTRYKNLDIHFSDGMSERSPALNLLALDCFHPNRDGQQMISDVLWADQPWFR